MGDCVVVGCSCAVADDIGSVGCGISDTVPVDVVIGNVFEVVAVADIGVVVLGIAVVECWCCCCYCRTYQEDA